MEILRRLEPGMLPTPLKLRLDTAGVCIWASLAPLNSSARAEAQGGQVTTDDIAGGPTAAKSGQTAPGDAAERSSYSKNSTESC